MTDLNRPRTDAERKRKQRLRQRIRLPNEHLTKEAAGHHILKIGIPLFVTRHVKDGTTGGDEYRQFWRQLGFDTEREGELERLTELFIKRPR